MSSTTLNLFGRGTNAVTIVCVNRLEMRGKLVRESVTWRKVQRKPCCRALYLTGWMKNIRAGVGENNCCAAVGKQVQDKSCLDCSRAMAGS